MTLSLDARKQILLHFLLGIALPAVLLGYLAFRGIQNDRALVERQRLGEQQRVVRLVTDSVDAAIRGLEGEFRRVATRSPDVSDDGLLGALADLERRLPVVEETFLVERSGTIRIPVTRLLFSRGDTPPPPEAGENDASREFRRGQEYEFRRRDLRRALAAYRRSFETASTDASKASALAAIARIHAKAGRATAAVAAYRRLVNEFPDVQLADGIPAQAAAGLELGSLALTAADTTGALSALLTVYRGLVETRWSLAKPQFDFFSRRARGLLQTVFDAAPSDPRYAAYRDTMELLRDREGMRRARTERLLTFREGGGRVLLARMARDPTDASVRFHRFVLDLEGRTYVGSLLAPEGGFRSRSDSIWGFLLDSEAVAAGILAPAIHKYMRSDAIGWSVHGPAGTEVLSSIAARSGRPTVIANLPGNFPPWTLELYRQDPGFLNELLGSRRSVYFYAFLLLAGILVFGLTLTIRTVNHQLELARLKSDFVSTVSHEFKSPLTAIRQLSEMLRDGRVPSVQRRRKYYNVLLEQSERLSLLVDNVLGLAELEEGRPELCLEKADLGALLEEVVSAARNRVQHDEFVIQMEIEDSLPPAVVDRAAIAQAIDNLIDNAIKYSGRAKEVVVRGFREDDHLVINVQDFGVGIGPNESERVFERFYRGGDELTRSVKGTGLGLALVKRIALRHGGSIQVTSQPGEGSTFSLRLPLDSTAGEGEVDDSENRGEGDAEDPGDRG